MSLVVAPAEAEKPVVWTTLGLCGSFLRAFHTAVNPVSAAWPANNQAYLFPFQVAAPVRFVEMFFQAGTSPGTTTYDLGIYDESFTRLTSLGSTAAVNTTDALLPVGGGTLSPAVTLTRGRYYMAMSAASTTLTVRAPILGNQVMRALGMFTMATAHPLPTTFVPASMGTTAFMPALGMNTTVDIL